VKRLILNADDFGLTPGVNEGIVRAHREGILTSATIMANGAAFEGAVEMAKCNPRLGVGCHIVLLGGNPVAPLGQIPSLVNAQGRLAESLPAFVARLSAGMLKRSEMETEIRAQIQKVRKAGIEPTHLDTHKHAHVHPRVMEALARVAQEQGIHRVRKPVENIRDSWNGSGGRARGLSKQHLSATLVTTAGPRFRSISRKYGLRSPDHFLGLAMTGKLGPEALRRMIGMVAEGETEIMLHPGICDVQLRGTGSRLLEQREDELAGLLDAGVRSTVEERGIRLISYRELN
jgi:hopanoid biosynthesis associated protein HpnK